MQDIKEKMLRLHMGSRTHISLIGPDLSVVIRIGKEIINDGRIDFYFSDDYQYFMRCDRSLEEICQGFKNCFPGWTEEELKPKPKKVVKPDVSKYVIPGTGQ